MPLTALYLKQKNWQTIKIMIQKNANIYENYDQKDPPQISRNFIGIGPKGYVRSDKSIEDEVCKLLARDQYLDPSDIVVRVMNGVVLLSGIVNEREERILAERIVGHVSGVEDIENDISVRKMH